MGLYFRMMTALGGWEVELTIIRMELYIIIHVGQELARLLS